ncbi:FAD-binding dehydrogenase [Phytoactinopolyspora mesophila]|uniref:FAD-binding dehydrogenase n=1 Tax=Phytoactinopolyspora mesophila TaxID=2650750 RepID=A0A7K3M4T7_9ACTN|nr:FAD-binding dehydrogenase [Phytoactinopolyspora mesophila]NDL58265.1 FAD-binding dehydrogenase [Phytoactinopolyspora mesophila]
MSYEADVVVVGAGLAGLVATAELVDAGRRVALVDQEPAASLGGQAHWSFGGLFMVNSPEQRRLGIRDSVELAWRDWLGTAGFDRPEDYWPTEWARAYVEFAGGEKRAWLRSEGVSLFPIVQWAERGGGHADGPGNSVPRFHVTWGTGPGVLEPFLRRLSAAEDDGRVTTRYRHRVGELILDGGAVHGVRGEVLAPSTAERGAPSSRDVVGEFEIRAPAVIVAAGGIGANADLVRQNWPSWCGQPPARMLSGVPDHVDGRMLGVAEAAGGQIINPDRMWHYPEGLTNYAPVWSNHGIRLLSGPSPMWVDARGRRLPFPIYPGYDTLAAVGHIARSGHGHSWLVLNRRIASKEFALSGSEQNPDLTGRDIRGVLERRGSVMTGPVGEFLRRGADFVIRNTVSELVEGMNERTDEPLIEAGVLEREIAGRDGQFRAGLGKDAQLAAIRAARRYVGDRLVRVVPPHALLDPDAGPLVAVKLSILTRKTLGGLHTDLSARVLGESGSPVPGLYAAGEAAGFGGGGMHGYRALEGTFLGGCLFTGRVAGRAAAAAGA